MYGYTDYVGGGKKKPPCGSHLNPPGLKAWFDEATKHANIEEANSMCLATATSDGLPSARKGFFDEHYLDIFFQCFGSVSF